MTAESTTKLLRELAAMLDAEAHKETPPSRPELVEQWAGVHIHFLKPLPAFGDYRRRGDELVLSAEQIRESVDRKGASFLDGVPNAAVGLGPFPETELPWSSDDDPAREALHREAVEELQRTNPNATARQWEALHAQFGTTAQRDAYAKKMADREQLQEAARVRVFGADA